VSFKIEVNNVDLAKQLKRCCEIIPASGPSPILNNVLLTFSEDGLGLITTDLTNTIKARVLSAGKQEGIDCIAMADAKKLMAMVEGFSEKRITVFFDDKTNIIYLSSNRQEMNITSFGNACDFPHDDSKYDFVEDVVLSHDKVPVSCLQNAISHISWALPNAKGTSEYNYIFFRVKDGVFTAYAYTGIGIAKYKIENVFKGMPNCEFVLPPKGLLKLAKYKNDEKELILTVGANLVRLELDEAEYTIKRSAVKSADFESRMCGLPMNKCKVDTLLLGNAMKSLFPVAEDVVAKVNITVEDDEITCKANHGGTSAGMIRIKAKDCFGDNLTGNFNLKQIHKVTEEIVAPKIQLYFDSETTTPKLFIEAKYVDGAEMFLGLLAGMNPANKI
jgi:DNA polymerase III sliding clamp (beta) subunit (PCNA family)